MTVKELIKLLQTFPSNLQVAYRCCSEQVLLESDDIELKNGCPPRPDGWVQNERPDILPEQYVLFPGN
jgi:hypothetical protein